MDEEVQSPPTKFARFAVADTATAAAEMGLTVEKSQSIGLDLGLGPGVTTTHGIGKPCFTFFQMQELEHQALIFKYMTAGIPVPSHLILPIWKSFVTSASGIYPNFLGCRGVCFDYRNSMEPEPGRCRRTDGKKWRCSKDVVPDQKYCERHMHRGRNRSRKHVEISKQMTTAATSNAVKGSNTNLSISMPLQLMSSTPQTTTMTNNNNGSNASPILGFSPKSVLQAKAESLCE